MLTATPSSAEAAEAARREHHGEFYGLRPLPADDGRPLVTVAGNCQAGSVRVLLDGAPSAPCRSVRVPPLHELTAADVPRLQRLLAASDVLVCQPVRDDYRGLPIGTRQLAKQLPATGRLVLFPVVRYAGLHPWQVIVRTDAGDPPVVPYHDLRTVARAAGLVLDPPTNDTVRAVTEASLGELRTREQRHGTVVVSDLLTTAGAEAAHTINHPGNQVLIGLARRVQAALGWAPDATDPGRTLLDSVHAPLDPLVVAAHGLDVAPRPDWVVGGRAVPDADVVEAQLRWYAEHPPVVPAALQRHAPLLQLLGGRAA
ncbi:WcbI family polysaccharide biosynthesis putative acetyltransferase [Angustibacter aerolatus]